MQPIELSGTITQQNVTRADEQGFVTGDRMGIYIVDRVNGEAGVVGAKDNRAQNMIYTFNGEDYKWTAPTTVYWRDQQTPIDVYGYYPGANYISTPEAFPFEVQADQSTEARDGDLSGYEQSDLLWGKAENVAPTAEQIVVKFRHILAAVRVQLVKGTGISDTEWQKLDRIVQVENTRLQARVNLQTGLLSDDGTRADVKAVRMAPQSNDGYRAVVIPQTVSAGKVLLSITIDGTAYTHKLTSAMVYEPGKMHNFTMTVNKNETTGDYEISVVDDGITPWVNDESSHMFTTMNYVIVNCAEPGKLKESIAQAGYDYKNIQNLKVTGELTEEDFKLLREEMPELRHLNLKDVRLKHILYYDGWWNYGSHEHDLYCDDMLPGGAFYGNKAIHSMILPSTLKRIGDNAFREMNLMYSTLELPEGVTYIGTNAFAYNGYNGVEMIMPYSLDSICSEAFTHCMYRCELRLTDNIRYIGPNAFSGWQDGGCWNFYGTFHIPSKLTELSSGAFQSLGRNGSLQGEIEIPPTITKIPSNIFGHFTTGMQLTQISLANQVSLTIPNSVKVIEDYAFSGMRFKSVSLGDYVEALGNGAFLNAKMPFEIELPDALTSIGTECFMQCGIDGSLEIPEKCVQIGGRAFANNHISRLSLPSKLEMIPGGCFAINPELRQVVIPKYVNYIGEKAFASCPSIQTVICKSEEPPTLGIEVWGQWESWHSPGIDFDKAVLEVPEQSVELYRHADGWKDFKNITAYHELAFNIPEIVCLDKGTTRQGILRAESDWEVSECPSWVTVSPASGTYKDELTVTVANATESREGRIVFRLKDKNYTTYTDVRQIYSADYREDQTVTLQTASAGGTAIPLFFVGEGYNADDIASGQYLADMKEQMEHLFSTEPYKSYRQYFTVSTAYACSPESGLGGLLRFASDNWWENSNDLVWQYARQHATGLNDHAAVLVLCNTPAYGNHTDLMDDGRSFSWIGKTKDTYPYDQRGEVLHHLGGRGFGKLGPEYVNHFTFMKACGCPRCNMTNEYNWARSKGWWQNVSVTPKMSELPWYPFIFHENYAQYVDVYEGALNHARSTYRSENQSVMGAVHIYYYNTISRYEIVRRIMKAAGKSLSFEQFVANDKIEIPE